MLLCLRFGPDQYSEQEVDDPRFWDAEGHQYYTTRLTWPSDFGFGPIDPTFQAIESTLTAAKYLFHL
jgi:hypothetical protein